MPYRLIDRACSACLAATLTLAMLAGVDQLAQPEQPQQQVWARADLSCDVGG